MIGYRFGRASLSAAALALSITVAAAAPASAAIIALSDTSSGQSVTLSPGDRIKISLTARESQGVRWEWRVPTASDTGILHRGSRRTVPDGSATATFTAEGHGTTTITAHSMCKPVKTGVMCPAMVKTWKVTIKVG